MYSPRLDSMNRKIVGKIIFEPEVFFLHSTKAFDGLLQLIKLDLSKNNISVIPSDAFNGLVSLQSLDLSFNKLKKLENKTNGVLDTCLSLEEVSIYL